MLEKVSAYSFSMILFYQRLTSSILLHVESPQQTDGFVAAPTAFCFETWLDVSAIATLARGTTAGEGTLSRRRACRSWGVGCIDLKRPKNCDRVGVLAGVCGVFVNAEHATSSAKLVVDSAEVDLFDAKLSKQTGAHDTGLDCNVKSALSDDRAVDPRIEMKLLAVRVEVAFPDILVVIREQIRFIVRNIYFGTFAGLLAKLSLDGLLTIVGSVGQQGRQCHELSMAGTVPSHVRGIHASGDDRFVVDKNTANGRLVGPQC